MNDADFTRLLLGHLDIDDAVKPAAACFHAGRPGSRRAFSFLGLPLWRPPLDEVVT